MEIYRGNANEDGPEHRGWFVGHFMPNGDIRQNPDVELKWGVHPTGTTREEWVTDEERTTVCVLVSGIFTLIFRDHEETLAQPGDYVVWGPSTDHHWRVDENSTTLTVRWNPGQTNGQ